MKNGVIVTIITALLCFGVFSACIDEGEKDDPNIVTVKFNTDGGNNIPDAKIPKGSSLDEAGKVPPNPEKAGYDFVLWYDISEQFEDGWEEAWYMSAPIDKNMTLKAIWVPIDPNNGNITFDPANGANTQSRYCSVGSPIPNFPPDPDWVGYIFQGWFDTQDNLYTRDTIVTEVRITLKAKWNLDPNIRMVTVQFNTNGGNPASIPSVSIPEGSSLGAKFPANPSRSRWNFTGWFYDNFKYTASTPVNDDITLTAGWAQFGYQDDGSWLIDHSKFFQYYGANFTDGDTINFLERYGGLKYQFSDFGDVNLTHYTHFLIFFTLIPSINPATNLPYSPPFQITVAGIGPDTKEEGADVMYPQFTTGGNTVLVMNQAQFTSLKNIEGVHTLLLKQNSESGFSMKISSMMFVNSPLPQVTAVFDPGNGTALISKSAAAGSTLGANFPAAPVREGYSFVRWYDTITGSTIANNTIIGNMTVKAEWIEILTVTFMNGGEQYAEKKVKKGSSLGADFPVNPNKAGFNFIGWYKESDTTFQNPYLNTTIINENVTLISYWLDPDAISTVTFDSAGGNNIGSVELEKGQSLGNRYPVPVKPNADYHNFVFIGWFDISDEENPVEYTKDTLINGSVKLTAKWQDVVPHIAEAVKVEVNEGTEDDPEIVEYDGTLFNAVGNWTSSPGIANKTEPFFYNDKFWWVTAAVHTADAGWTTKAADFPQEVYDAIKEWHATGYTRIAFPFPGEASAFSKVTVVYDMVHIGGGTPSGSPLSIQLRTDPNASGGSGIAANYIPEETLVPGDNKTFTRDKAAFTQSVMAIVKQASANQMLVRFSKVIFHN